MISLLIVVLFIIEIYNWSYNFHIYFLITISSIGQKRALDFLFLSIL